MRRVSIIFWDTLSALSVQASVLLVLFSSYMRSIRSENVSDLIFSYEQSLKELSDTH